MKVSRLALGTLAGFLLTSAYSQQGNAQTSTEWVGQALGSYQSQIWSAGSLISGTTEFRETDDGSPKGSYTMNESGELVSGTLSQCQAVQVLIMRCVWNDKYGTGNLEVTFSDDFLSFTGYWGEGSLEPSFPWNGSR